MAFTALHRTSQQLRTSQRSPCVTVQPGFSYTSRFSYSFSYSFSYKIFSEQLCFSIDLAISSLL